MLRGRHPPCALCSRCTWTCCLKRVVSVRGGEGRGGVALSSHPPPTRNKLLASTANEQQLQRQPHLVLLPDSHRFSLVAAALDGGGTLSYHLSMFGFGVVDVLPAVHALPGVVLSVGGQVGLHDSPQTQRNNLLSTFCVVVFLSLLRGTLISAGLFFSFLFFFSARLAPNLEAVDSLNSPC